MEITNKREAVKSLKLVLQLLGEAMDSFENTEYGINPYLSLELSQCLVRAQKELVELQRFRQSLIIGKKGGKK